MSYDKSAVLLTSFLSELERHGLYLNITICNFFMHLLSNVTCYSKSTSDWLICTT